MGGCLFVAQDNRERTLSFSYRQEYTLNGWADKEIGLLWPTLGRGIWIAHYHHFGDESYNEQQASAGYSLDVSESVQVGIIGQYFRLSVDDGWYEAQQLRQNTVSASGYITAWNTVTVRIISCVPVLLPILWCLLSAVDYESAIIKSI